MDSNHFSSDDERGLTRSRKELFVRDLFDSLSRRYDAFNTLASLGLHRRWRDRALRQTQLPPDGTLVDFCCGTGDFLELAARRFGANVRLVGLDFSPQMLGVARARLRGLELNGRLELRLCNVEATGLPSGQADAVTCGFALRNVDSLERTFREMHRVLRERGRAVLLELAQPDSPLLRKGFWLYMDQVLPLLGMPILGKRKALQYLSASVRGFKPPQQIVELLRAAGFAQAWQEPLCLGVCRVYVAIKGQGGDARADQGR